MIQRSACSPDFALQEKVGKTPMKPLRKLTTIWIQVKTDSLTLKFIKTFEIEAINELELQSFTVCNKDGEPGLTWDEVEMCVDSYGHLFKDVNIPTQEDFDHFDTNGDGVLFYNEWLDTLA